MLLLLKQHTNNTKCNKQATWTQTLKHKTETTTTASPSSPILLLLLLFSADPRVSVTTTFCSFTSSSVVVVAQHNNNNLCCCITQHKHPMAMISPIGRTTRTYKMVVAAAGDHQDGHIRLLFEKLWWQLWVSRL
eukprot:GHVS01061115.1.p1 GENE.GHVS01061115.1~~GHVS01061115.1.p1  ORF type:complete len:134 (+),score=46.76 GHVS01061115.1:239-640(+)